MAIERKEVEHGKEISDVMMFLVEIVKHFKSGKGAAEMTELLDELINAINGIDQVKGEFESNRKAAFNSVLLPVGDLLDVLLGGDEPSVSE